MMERKRERSNDFNLRTTMEVPNSSNVDRPSPARYGSVNLRRLLEFDNIANVDRPANSEAETSEEKASSTDLSHGFSEFSQSGDSLRFGGSVNFLSHIDGGSYSSVENYHAQAGRKLQLGPPQERGNIRWDAIEKYMEFAHVLPDIWSRVNDRVP
ncbi:hypothetical protein OROGR_032378 [Orobanche gracilis]